MNLQYITTDLDLNLRRHLRRTDTIQRWTEHLGSACDLDTLYRQIRDTERTVSHPVLAVFVDLAKQGDNVAAQAVTVAHLRDRAKNLERALASNRDIGTAVGVLIAQHKLTREQAFDLLRIASQNTNRKLHDVALDVIDTGAVEITPRGWR